MRTIKLATVDGKIIYESQHNSFAEAVEFAIAHDIPLDGVDLSDAILLNINLDGIRIHNASFKGADLRGANMSEANFFGCDFSGANLTDACLCYSNLKDCNLKYATFDATDISMITLVSCAFEGFSTFYLNFNSAYHFFTSTYQHFGKAYLLTDTPILVTAGENSFALLGKVMILKDLSEPIDLHHTTKNNLKDAIENMQSTIVFPHTTAFASGKT